MRFLFTSFVPVQMVLLFCCQCYRPLSSLVLLFSWRDVIHYKVGWPANTADSIWRLLMIQLETQQLQLNFAKASCQVQNTKTFSRILIRRRVGIQMNETVKTVETTFVRQLTDMSSWVQSSHTSGWSRNFLRGFTVCNNWNHAHLASWPSSYTNSEHVAVGYQYILVAMCGYTARFVATCVGNLRRNLHLYFTSIM